MTDCWNEPLTGDALDHFIDALKQFDIRKNYRIIVRAVSYVAYTSWLDLRLKFYIDRRCLTVSEEVFALAFTPKEWRAIYHCVQIYMRQIMRFKRNIHTGTDAAAIELECRQALKLIDTNFEQYTPRGERWFSIKHGRLWIAEIDHEHENDGTIPGF